MKRRFRSGERVRVLKVAVPGRDIAGTYNSTDAFTVLGEGALGTVVRVKMGDDGAWVALDQRLTGPLEVVHPFSIGDSRGNHIMVYPEQVIPAGAK